MVDIELDGHEEGGTRIGNHLESFLFPVDPVVIFSEAAGVYKESGGFEGVRGNR